MRHPVRKSSTDLTLYRLHACPYCERVVRKLEADGLDFQSRYVTPVHSTRDVVALVSGSRTVPVLVDQSTGVTMSESGNIVDYLDRMYGDAS